MKVMFKKPWFVLVLVVALLGITFGVHQYASAQSYLQEMNNQYNRAFYEFAESMQNVEVSLQKGLLITSPRQMVRLSNEINKKTQAAKTALAQLPFEKTHIDQISKYLTQAGDYTYALAMKMTNDEKLADKDYATMKELIRYGEMLNQSIQTIQSDLSAGKLTLNRVSNAFNQNIQTLDVGMSDLENQFADFPALVYDGPFSSHLDNVQPKMTQGMAEITAEEALQKAKWFINSGDKPIKVTGEVGGNLPAYSITCYPEGEESEHMVNVDISKAGGLVIWFLDNRNAQAAAADINSAKRAAEEFLANKGYMDLKDSYYEVTDNIATINYAYVQDSVIMYSDLIKVKVALDDCTVVGMESKGYIMSHTKRDFPQPAVSRAAILDKVPPSIQVNNLSLAVIPKDDKTEVFCYEVKGSAEERNFLIYYDAQTGAEIKIMMLIESESGTLSM